ncbi:MAG: glycerol-3-phosphate dehydrogenase/oxidase [Pseudomonadales bacterium]
MNARDHRYDTTARLGVDEPATLAGQRVDVLVIGGGITGAGAARHAAQCGLRTLLLEAGDFAAGTSSRSTKLIHGGLRYLAMGDVALVRESALERKSLLAMAPHLTEPRWMLVPARRRRDYLKLRVGIGLYEWLGAVPREERHRNWNRQALAEGEPLLDRERLPWACVYREYLTDDARLVLGTLRGAAAHGASICNYVRVLAVAESASGSTATVLDERSGATFEIGARCVVNAAGPWVESLLPADPDASGPRLHLSKGVHLVVARERLPVRHMVMMTAADGRPVFAIARAGVTYVGTTDTTHQGGPEHWPEVSASDIGYLIDTVNAHFASVAMTDRDVLASWAGLRPLINQPGKAAREMSRRDEIWRRGTLVTVAGGKLTGFRKMAEAAMAAVAEVLKRDLTMPTPLEPVAGGDIEDVEVLIEEVGRHYQVDARVATRLVRLYGSEVGQVLGQRPRPLSPSVYAEEVYWALDVEGARTLEDVVYRRLRAAWFLPDEVAQVVERVATLLSEHFDWSEGERLAQIAAVRRRLADELAFRQVPVSPPSRRSEG